MIDWIVKVTDMRLLKHRKNRKTYFNDYKNFNADKVVKYCTQCKRCWEYEQTWAGRTIKRIIYYENFVTYGKKRKTCRYCIITKKEKI